MYPSPSSWVISASEKPSVRAIGPGVGVAVATGVRVAVGLAVGVRVGVGLVVGVAEGVSLGRGASASPARGVGSSGVDVGSAAATEGSGVGSAIEAQPASRNNQQPAKTQALARLSRRIGAVARL